MQKEFSKFIVLSKAEVDYLLLQLETRKEFIISDVHKVAYLLDPRYLGEWMSQEEKDKAENAIWEYQVPGTTLTGEDLKVKLFNEYTKYLITISAAKEGGDFRYNMLSWGSKTILQYWQVDCPQYTQLQVLGCRVFSLAVSSAASKCGFSTNKFNHSVLRNCLSAACVGKLNFITINGKHFASSDFNYEELEDKEDKEGEEGSHIVVLEWRRCSERGEDSQ